MSTFTVSAPISTFLAPQRGEESSRESSALPVAASAASASATVPQRRRPARNKHIYECRKASEMAEERKRHRVTTRIRRDRGSGDEYEEVDDNYYEVDAEVNYLATHISAYIRLVDYLNNPRDSGYPEWVVAGIDQFNAWANQPENQEILESIRDTMRTIRVSTPMVIFDPSIAFDPDVHSCSSTDAEDEIFAGTYPDRRYINLSFLLSEYARAKEFEASTNTSAITRVIRKIDELTTRGHVKYEESDLYSYIFSRFRSTELPTLEEFTEIFHRYLYFEAVDGLQNLHDTSIDARYSDNHGIYPEDVDDEDAKYYDDAYGDEGYGDEVYDDDADYGYGDEGDGDHSFGYANLPKKEKKRRQKAMEKSRKREEERKERLRVNAALIASKLFIEKPNPRNPTPKRHYVSPAMHERATAVVAQALEEVQAKTGLQVPVAELLHSWTLPAYYLNGASATMYEVTPSQEIGKLYTRKYMGLRDMTQEEIEQAYKGTLKNTPELEYSYMYTSACGSASTTSNRSPKSFANKENVPLPPNRTRVSGATERERVYKHIHLPQYWERKMSNLVYVWDQKLRDEKHVYSQRAVPASAGAGGSLKSATYGSSRRF